MSKERTVFRIPSDLKPSMQAEATRLGFSDGRGPGLSKYFIWLHDEHVKGQRIEARIEGEGFDVFIVDDLPEPAVTFESMTQEEQASYLLEVFCRAKHGSPLESAVTSLLSRFDMSGAKPVGPETPDYEAHYEATLAYVKKVMR